MKFYIGFAIALLIFIGCDKSSPSASSSSSGPTKVTLQLNWKPEPQFGGFYAAKVTGAYAKNGLDVEVREGGAGAPTIDMVSAGTVPFAIVSGDEIIVARSKGKKVVALYAVYQTHPQGIMTRASRGFKDLGDVFKADGTLAMEQGLPYSDFLKHKYGFGSLKIVPSPFGDLSVFRSDEKYSMQCFVTSEPLAASKVGIEPKTFLIADSGFNPYATVLATNEEYLNANHAAVVAMVKSVAAGWEAYLSDPAETNSHMAKLNQTMDPKTFADSAAAQKPLISPAGVVVGSMTNERWGTLAKQLLELKVIDKAPAASDCYVDLRR